MPGNHFFEKKDNKYKWKHPDSKNIQSVVYVEHDVEIIEGDLFSFFQDVIKT